MKVSFRVLASGSNGNASLITTPEGSLLIDDGISQKRLLSLIENTGIQMDDITGILITHGHGDHIQGLPVLMSSHEKNIYSTRGTQNCFLAKGWQDSRWTSLAKKMTVIPSNGHFTIGPFEINSFPTVHDAEDPVSYTVTVDGIGISTITDTGKLTEAHLNTMLRSTVVLIEMNHDIDLLLKSKRPLFLKRRIRACHLANEETLGYLGQLKQGNIKNLFIGHLSGECNSPEQVEEAISFWEESNGRPKWSWSVCDRYKPSKMVTIDTNEENKEFRKDLELESADKEVKYPIDPRPKIVQKSVLDFFTKKSS
ncbi:MAG: MBL fold metallo-hydrolase [Candidatus Hodarchaeales archaeon]